MTMLLRHYDTVDSHRTPDGRLQILLLRHPETARYAVVLERDGQVTSVGRGGREGRRFAPYTSGGIDYVAEWTTERTARRRYEQWIEVGR